MQPTLNQQVLVWATEASTREYRPLSLATIRKHLSYLKWVLPMLGDTTLDQINEDSLHDVFDRLQTRITQRQRSLSPQTLESILKTILLVKGSYRDENGRVVYLKRERKINRLAIGLLSIERGQ